VSPKRKPARDRHRDRGDRPPGRPPSIERSHGRRRAVAAAWRLKRPHRRDCCSDRRTGVLPASAAGLTDWPSWVPAAWPQAVLGLLTVRGKQTAKCHALRWLRVDVLW